MTATYRVRKSNNAQVINDLQKQLYDSDELPVFAMDDREWWVVWHGEVSVAYAALRITGSCAWFSICGVVEAHRGHGLQKRLITARLAFAKKKGIASVYTYTINGNHPSARSLIHKGFVPCTPPAEHYGCWAGVRDVLYWKREL